ncbi:MAG: LppX_LprAFG lipoprotein [Nocardioidaceae bacterium]
MVLGIAACALLATSCSSSSGGGSTSADLPDRLSAARSTLDDAASIDFQLSTDNLPSGTTGLVSAEGTGNHDPAFKGSVTVSAGASISADVVCVGGTVYAKIGFLPTYAPLDPASYGAPNPADFFATDTGVSSLLTATKDPVAGEQSRDGDTVLSTIDGTLAGDVVQTLVPSADSGGSFDVEWRLTGDDTLRDATISGPFYPGADDVTYSIAVAASTDPVDISAP